MGRKSKTNQRTKNNTRPSSSGRSAELLGGLAGSSLLPALAARGAALTPEFELAFKKLNKKDPITKTKALHELSELVGKSEVEDVAAALPAWAHSYPALAADDDRRVREATQACHGCVMSACGRRAAPHLRALLPAWLLACHDEHAPARTRASAVLQSTFPAGKQHDAVAFCREEVLTMLLQHLTAPAAVVTVARNKKPGGEAAGAAREEEAAGATPEGEAASAAREEEAARAARAISAALRTLGDVCTALMAHGQHQAWLRARLKPLLEAKPFWRLAQHHAPGLRAAWYDAVAEVAAVAVAEVAADAGADVAADSGAEQGEGDDMGSVRERVLRVALGASEPAAPAAPALWCCLLRLAHTAQNFVSQALRVQNTLLHNTLEYTDLVTSSLPFQDWSVWEEQKNLLAKRILGTLKSGGWGKARTMGAVLRELLSRLPAHLFDDHFYDELPHAALRGLQERSVLSSKIERQAWLDTVGELVHLVAAREDAAAVPAVSRALRGWLDVALVSRALLQLAAAGLTGLVRRWLQLAGAEPEPRRTHYDRLVRVFWQNVSATMLALVDAAPTDPALVVPIAEVHALLLHTLRATFMPAPTVTTAVRFHDSTDTADKTSPQSPAPAPPAPADLERFNHNLMEVVTQMVVRYFQFAQDHDMPEAVLPALICMVEEFECGRVLAGEVEDAVGVLRGWIVAGRGGPAAVRALLLVLPHLPAGDQARLLAWLNEEEMPECAVEWCVEACAVWPDACEAGRRWAGGARAGRALRATAGRAARGNAAAANLLLACLQPNTHESVLSEETVLGVMDDLCSALSELHSADDERLEACMAVCARVADAAVGSGVKRLELAYHLLMTTLHATSAVGVVSAGSALNARRAWRRALSTAPPPDREHILGRVANKMHRLLIQDTQELDVSRVERLAALCPVLLVAGSSAGDAAALAELLLTGPAPASPEPYALRADCMQGRLRCPPNEAHPHLRHDALADHEDITMDLLVPYLYDCLFRALCLRSIIVHQPADEAHRIDEACDVDHNNEDNQASQGDRAGETGQAMRQVDEVEESEWCGALLTEQVVREQVLQMMHEHSVVTAMCHGYAAWHHHGVLDSAQRRLEDVLGDVVRRAPVPVRHDILEVLSPLAELSGYYWAYARARYCRMARLPTVSVSKSLDAPPIAAWKFHSLQAEACLSEDGLVLLAARQVGVRRALLAALADDELAVTRILQDMYQASSAYSLDLPVATYHRYHHVIIQNQDVSEAEWSCVSSTAAICEMAATLVASRGWHMPPDHWDFITVKLGDLMRALQASRQHWGTFKVSLVYGAVLSLLVAVDRFVGGVRARCEREQPSSHVAALPGEWEDVLAPHVAACLATIVLHVLESREEFTMTSVRACVVGALLDAVLTLGGWRLGADREQSEALARAAASTLAEPDTHHVLKYLAHATLRLLVEPLATYDAELVAAWSETAGEGEGEGDDADRFASMPALVMAMLDQRMSTAFELLAIALEEYREGEDTCGVAVGSDAHGAALGALLLWDAAYALSALQQADFIQIYIHLFNKSSVTELAVRCALRLLPANVVSAARAQAGARATTPPHTVHDEFERTQQFSVHEPASSEDVSWLACRALLQALAGPGCSATRAWWGAAEPRAASLLSAVVRTRIAPVLARKQLQHLQDRTHHLPDTEVSIMWGSYEAQAAVRVEERVLQLSITLGPEWPLVLPRVVAPPPAPGSPCPPAQWVVMYLAHQNGTLFHAFKTWVLFVNERVSASAQCYICYCRMHPTTGRLPRTTCHQCRNKFHIHCLRKWFTSSKKSNCPVCRTTF